MLLNSLSSVYEGREMESTTRAIGREVVAFMFESKMTREQMATHLGISTVTLWKKLNGHNEWRWSEILKLCELTGKSPDELAGLK